MQRRKYIAGFMSGILLAVGILQPLTLYVNAEELQSESIANTIADSESIQERETESEIEMNIQSETESGAESADESEPEIYLEPVRYVISEMYHGQGKVTIRDNFDNVYEIPDGEEELSFECDEQTQLLLQAEPADGYEIDTVEFRNDDEIIEKIDDRDILNGQDVYEKTIAVSSNLKIQVNFVEVSEETTGEAVPETETQLIAETEDEPQTEKEPDTETSPESEIDESQDGILSEEEQEQALQLSGEMENVIAANERVMTLNLGEVGQSWAMFEVFVNRILISEFGANPVTHFSHIIQTGADYSEFTRTAYCVQYGVSIPAGSHATEMAIPQQQQNYMGYALAYGWKQSGTAYDEEQYKSDSARTEYAVTQAVVWACSQGKFGTDAGEAAIRQILQNTYDPAHAAAYYQQLKEAILKAETIPSFSGSDGSNPPTILLTWNSANNRYEATVTDTNGVLNQYNYIYEGIHFEKDGDTLIVWTNNLYTDGVTAEAVYENNGGANAVVTWDGENGTQDLTTYTEITNQVYSYVRIVTEGMGALELIKKSASPEITDKNSSYSLEGAVYGVYDAANQEIGRITTNADGWGRLTDIPTGDYVLKEISAPRGYYVDTSSYNVKIIPGQTAVSEVLDIPKTDSVDIVLGKIDAETNSNQPSGSKSLEKALFEVKFYSVQMDSNPAASGYIPERKWILRTDTDGFCKLEDDYKISGDDFYYSLSGNAELPSGTITIQEKQAPEGYLVNNEIFVRKIVPGDSSTISTYNYPVISEIPQKVQIVLDKVDSETNSGTAQGAGTLAGASYEILDSNNKVVDTLVADDAGHAISKELPLGVYKLRETAASDGYLVDENIYTVAGLKPKDTTTRVFKYKAASGEDIIRGDVEIIKFYENMDVDNDMLQGIMGVEFTFTSKTTGKVVKKIVTDKDGFATTASSDQPRGSLVFDTYIVTETEYPADVKPIEPFEVTISEEGVTLKGIYKEDKLIVSPVTVVKKDKRTGNRIPAADTEFRLLDANKNPITMTTYYPDKIVCETFKTNEKGQFTFPDKLRYGTYFLEEIHAPDGYLKGELLEFKVTDGAGWENPLVIEYYDEPVMGKIRLEKRDSETAELLDGTEFDLIAAEDIITPDGTLHLKKGDAAGHMTTKDGIAESEKLYLGSYEIRETKQPDGYVLSDEVYSVTLEYKNQETPVVVQSVNVTNSPVKVRIIKVDAESGKVLPGVEFKIWNKAMNEDDIDSGMAADVLYETNEKGIIEIGYLAPGTYCVQETKSIYGYAPNDKICEFVVSEDGRIDGKEIGEIRITNSRVEIGTTAADKADGDKVISADEDMTIIDRISYKNLVPGHEYGVSGILMDKSTGKPLLVNGKEVISEMTFIAEKPDGEVRVEFNFDASALAEKTVVVFEKLIYGGKEIAMHEDINDIEQSIEVVPPERKTTNESKGNETKDIVPDSPKTGDRNNLSGLVGMCFMSALMMILILNNKKKFK